MNPLLTPGSQANPFLQNDPFEALRLARTAMSRKEGAQKTPTVGEERTIPIGTQYYTGKTYGWQTPGALEKIAPERASQDQLEQDYFRELQKNLRGQAEAKKQESDPRGKETPTSTGQPSQQPAAQGADAELKDLLDVYKKYAFDPAFRARMAEQDTQNFIKRALVTQALSLEATRENTRRQVEVKNIEAWKELERARIEANSRQALAFGQTVALALTPNQGLMQGMNQAFANAMAPFEGFALKG